MDGDRGQVPGGEGGELAALAAEAERIEVGAGATVEDGPQQRQQQEAEQQQRTAAELLSVLQIIVGIVGKVRPDVAACFTPADCEQIAQAGAAVCIKHGWAVGELFGAWQAEITLALALVGPGVKLAALVKANRAQAAADADAP